MPQIMTKVKHESKTMTSKIHHISHPRSLSWAVRLSTFDDNNRALLHVWSSRVANTIIYKLVQILNLDVGISMKFVHWWHWSCLSEMSFNNPKLCKRDKRCPYEYNPPHVWLHSEYVCISLFLSHMIWHKVSIPWYVGSIPLWECIFGGV